MALHTTTHTNSMSAISHLVLIKIQQNFEEGFSGSSLTLDNCPGIIGSDISQSRRQNSKPSLINFSPKDVRSKTLFGQKDFFPKIYGPQRFNLELKD